VTYSVSTFGTYISGQLDGERIGGCSWKTYGVVARELGSWISPQVVC
jgi:hypothetical protein